MGDGKAFGGAATSSKKLRSNDPKVDAPAARNPRSSAELTPQQKRASESAEKRIAAVSTDKFDLHKLLAAIDSIVDLGPREWSKGCNAVFNHIMNEEGLQDLIDGTDGEEVKE